MDTLDISDTLKIPMNEISMTAIRSSGPGGQNVNKVASAIHLRFDSGSCAAIPDRIKARMRQLPDYRIKDDGEIVIKSQAFRSQEKNRQAALTRLAEIIKAAMREPKRRIRTKPSKRAKQKRLDSKNKRGQLKQTRRLPNRD